MKIIHTNDFIRAFGKLPKEVKRLYVVQERRFKDDWRDPRLHIKKVKTLTLAFSFRITRRYRAFFYFQSSDSVVFFDIDHRRDAYKF